ncbi:MAG TPA: DUF4124 domain-containing protein [Rhodocyclaceae bacterium]
MKLRLSLILLALPLSAAADTLYKCTDENGVVLYTNQKNAAKNCSVLSREQPISTFSAPKTKPPSDFPRVAPDQQKARDNDRRAILGQELATEQKLLEDARKALAEQESTVNPDERNVRRGGVSSINEAKVQERLQPYRDAVQLHERNIEALNKEIANLK